MADMWKCHKCQYVNLNAHAPACVNCGHQECPLCTPVPRAMSTTEEDESNAHVGTAIGQNANSTMADGSLTPTTQDISEEDSLHISITIEDGAPFETPPHNDTPTPVHNLTQPSMTGWWMCCISWCKQLNNPALTSGHCSSCEHKKCSSCTKY